MRRRWSSWPVGVVSALVVVVLSAGGCSSGGGKPVVAPSTVATTSTTTSVSELDALLVSRWTAAYQASLAAAKNPKSAGLIALLSDYFSGDALNSLLSTYGGYARDGLTSVGGIDFGQPSVLSVAGSTAVLRSCTVNRLALVYSATGTPVPGSSGSEAPVSVGLQSTMTLSPSGLWKVSAAESKEGSCAK